MAEKGRNPAISICAGAFLYQGRGGTSLGYLVVLTGALKSACMHHTSYLIAMTLHMYN